MFWIVLEQTNVLQRFPSSLWLLCSFSWQYLLKELELVLMKCNLHILLFLKMVLLVS